MSADIPTAADFTLEQTVGGRYQCPASGCHEAFEKPKDVTVHYYPHDSSLGEDIVGEDRWYAFLDHESTILGKTPIEIAGDLPPLFGNNMILSELKRLGLRSEGSHTPSHSPAQVLEYPHVTTIEKAREVARRRREAQL